MIIVDENRSVFNWFNEIEQNSVGCVYLDRETFEISNGIESELILISATMFHLLSDSEREKLNKCSAVLICKMQDEKITNLSQNIVGVIHKDDPIDLTIIQMSNIETLIKSNNVLKSELLTMSMELSEMIGGVETELFRIKRAYEKHAPKRLENFQGFKIFSKYAAGEDMGGEFFDLFAKENSIFIMMSATTSYLASSAILQLFAELKSGEEISSEIELKFISDVKEQVADLAKSQKKDVSAQLLTLILDVNTLQLTGHVLGNFKNISSDVSKNCEYTHSLDSELEVATFSSQLKRGERFMLCSPGFMMNWAAFNPKFMIEELIMKRNIKVLDILDEVYFQLKNEAKNNFLKTDASSIIVEVQDNVMLQI